MHGIRQAIHDHLERLDPRFTPAILNRHLPDAETLFEELVRIYASRVAEGWSGLHYRVYKSVQATVIQELVRMPPGFILGAPGAHDGTTPETQEMKAPLREASVEP